MKSYIPSFDAGTRRAATASETSEGLNLVLSGAIGKIPFVLVGSAPTASQSSPGAAGRLLLKTRAENGAGLEEAFLTLASKVRAG
jgi:hypothetical protein